MKKNLIILDLIVLLLYSCGNNYEKSGYYLNKGIEYLNSMELKKASNMFDKSLHNDPNNTEAIANKIRIMFFLNDTNGVSGLVGRAIKIDSLSPSILASIGMYFMDCGKFETSTRYFEKAFELDSSKACNYSNLGLALLAGNNINSAKYYLDKAIESDSSQSILYTNRSQYFINAGDNSSALEDLRKGVSYGKNKRDKFYASFSKGMLHRNMNEFEKSINDFTEAIVAYPSYDMNYYYRGLSYSATHQYRNALNDFIKAKKLGNRNVQKKIKECHYMIKTGA